MQICTRGAGLNGYDSFIYKVSLPTASGSYVCVVTNMSSLSYVVMIFLLVYFAD